MRERLARREYRRKLDAQFITDVAIDRCQEKRCRSPDKPGEGREPHDPAAGIQSADSTIGVCVDVDLRNRRMLRRSNLAPLLSIRVAYERSHGWPRRVKPSPANSGCTSTSNRTRGSLIAQASMGGQSADLGCHRAT
jgi:hypothetical protein